MAKIPRKTQKIFAENAGSLMLTAFGTAMTNNPTYTTDLDEIQNANFQSGWASAIKSDKAPYEEDTNGLFYAFTKQIAYILQQGLSIEYDANTTYYKGSIVAVINNTTVKFYISLTDDNLGNNVTDGVNWQLHSISKIDDYYNSLLSQIDNCVKLSGNQSIGGTKTFTSVCYGTKSANNNSLLTTVSKTGLGTQSGYIELGNGIIINWLKFSQTTNSQSHTWKKKFTSATSYVTMVSQIQGGRSAQNIAVQEQTPSTFKVYAENVERAQGLYAFAIGT